MSSPIVSSPSATPRLTRLVWLLNHISPVVEEIEKRGYEDFGRACKDALGDGSFPKLTKFAEEWRQFCGSFSGRFERYLVVSGVVVLVNYAISRITGVLDNPFTRQLSLAPAVFIFYSLLTSFVFSYVVPLVQDPICGLSMISSASKRGGVYQEMFLEMWRKAESLPKAYMQISFLGSVVTQVLAFNGKHYPLFLEDSYKAEFFVWTVFLFGSMPIISTFNTLQREVNPVLDKKQLKSNGRNF